MSVIQRTWKVEGVLTDVTSAVLSDPTGTFGIKRNDTDAVVVVDGTALSNPSTGVYRYEFDPISGVEYTAYVEFVYGGNTYHFEHDIPAVVSSSGIVTVEEIQTAMQVSLTGAQLAMINFIHPLVEGVFKTWLGTHAQYATTTEILPVGQSRNREPMLEDAQTTGSGTVLLQSSVGGLKTLQLRNIPVWEGSIAVYEDLNAKAGAAAGAFGASTQLDYGTECWLDVDDDASRVSNSGLLYRSGYWPQEPRTVKVSYYGGETAERLSDSNIASHVKLGALICHLHAFKAVSQMAGKSGKVKAPTSETIGKYSYSSPEGLALATSIANLGVPIAAQEAAFKAKNMAVFG